VPFRDFLLFPFRRETVRWRLALSFVTEFAREGLGAMEITRSLSAGKLQGPKHGLEGFKGSQRRPLSQELTPVSSAAGLGTTKVFLVSAPAQSIFLALDRLLTY
jgi:hypothetical protein